MSLFGNQSQQSQQQNQPLNQQSSLFGNPQQQGTANVGSSFPAQPQRSLFGNPQQSQANLTGGGMLGSLRDNQLHASLAGGYGSSSGGSLNASVQRDLALSRLQANHYSTKDSKSQLEQVQTLVKKWDPHTQDTLLQKYLYNYYEPAVAPFIQPSERDDPQRWEEALSNKPGPGYVPVLCRGFKEMGARIEHQAKVLQEFRIRLHEMNNSLDAVMRKHQLEITVKLESARRRHTQLAQSTLRLAVKTQMLRNRGYNLDGAEENLRKQLQGLEAQVLDPSFSGREEEIWARMVSLRERARWLEEEGKRVGEQVHQEQKRGVPDEVIERTKKILRDYDGQLTHLAKELVEVTKEFGEWQELQKS